MLILPIVVQKFPFLGGGVFSNTAGNMTEYLFLHPTINYTR